VLKFITGRPLWLNILVGGAIFFVLFFLFFQSLSWITRHDAVLPVPSVAGKSYDEAKQFLEKQGFEVQVQDTVFTDSLPLSAVVRQFPDEGTIVKENRVIFLSINRATAPDIPMPNLEGSTFKSAQIALEQNGLKIQDTSYRKDMARDMVLEQLFKGERIKPGTKIPMGSGISLVLGTGLGNEKVDMPDLFGFTLNEAKQILESTGLTLGNVVPQGASPNSYVYRQSHESHTPTGSVNTVRMGQTIDVWVQAQKPVRAAAPSADSTGGF
jgi:beta-lactam-binding protein with PASTA domain